jgi:hypothetical protein
VAATPCITHAAEKVNTRQGQQAFDDIKSARQILTKLDAPIAAHDWDAVSELLDQPPCSTLEKSLLNLVASNVLDREDKVQITG